MDMRSRSKIIINFSIVMTAICTILLTLCFFTSFDARLGYFSSDSILPVLFKIVYGASALGILVSTFIYTKEKESPVKITRLSPAAKIVLVCIGALLAVFSVYEAVSLMLRGNVLSYGAASSLGKLFFGAYLILTAAEKDSLRSPRLFCICFSALYPICSAMENFFNAFRPSNSVENTLCACVSIALLIYILNEARALVYGKVDRIYLPSVLLTLLTGASFSVSYIIAYAAGALYETSRFKYSVSLVLVSVYSAYLVFSFFQNKEESANKTENAEKTE